MRFPEFSGEWEKCKVSDLLDFYSTNSLSWEQLEYDTNAMMNLHYGLIHVGLPTMVDLAKDKLPNIKENNMPKNFELCKEGDVAFADASEDTNEVAKTVEFFNLAGKNVVCGLHTIHGRDNKHKTVVGFKGYAFSSAAFHNQIRRIAQGTKIYSISTKNFFECYIGLPSKPEQSKIATLLRLIDERIATQNKIIEDLKLLKSAISLNVLHSGTWKQFKIKDIAQIGRGRVISSIEISQQKNPTYPVYSSQTSNDGIMGYLDDYMFEGEYISWTTDGANAGTVFYRDGKFNCTNVCGLLKLLNGFDTHFVSLILAEATKKYVSINLANPKLMNNIMGNIQICLPEFEEQKRISIVFKKLQELLDVQKILLNQYSKQKQCLLRQMFI
ncbi:Type I restriction modification DNA specificity domain protein [Bacteroides thetaiotaomicron]|uniref:Restriction endonuclease subunit S n=1 Tax=Bacteroides uniformis TaxID=820 RepID=A0A1Y3VB67_BACUN|nr:restriction endonuclease subunit S [Bacteroides uniformis]QUT42441.1 Type I restriction modification DNA specificity domain protein [Bacteroides thetaiotaomicron]